MTCQRLVKDDQKAEWHKRDQAGLGHLFPGAKGHRHNKQT